MIKIDSEDQGFVLSFKGRALFRHHPKKPCLRVGKGRGRYKMRHGSFRIKDRVSWCEEMCAFDANQSSAEAAQITFGETIRLRLQVVDGRLRVAIEPLAQEINRLWLGLCASASEHIYGCGEQYTKLDLKGQVVPLWVEEQGIGRGKDLITFLANLTAGAGGTWYSTYFPQPTFVSSDNYFCHVQTTDYAIFDFSQPKQHQLHLWGRPTHLFFDVADTAPALQRSLTRLLGPQPPLPDWVHDGMWLGIQGGQQVVESKLQKATDAGVEVQAVWVQDWVGKRMTAFGKQLMWNWQFDPEMYPELPAFIAELKDRGIKFLGYINCFLAPEGALYREAKQRGLLVKDPKGQVYSIKPVTFPVAVLDLTNPETQTWIKTVIKKNMLGIGLDGWMADFGEHLPVDAVLYSGESAESYHNRYPVVWAQLNQEALQEAGCQDRAVFFTRAGYTGVSCQSPLFWAGDQLTNWSLDDGLATVIPAALSLGFCGISAVHSDIGGYTTVGWIRRSKELFGRWAEAAAFSPLMRTHEGLRPDANWQFDSDAQTLRHLAHLSRVFKRLKPYRLHSIDEYQQKGLPLTRHPYLHYEQDETLHRLSYQYLFGRDLMVAPVIRPKKSAWRVYLPDDEWIHLWSQQAFGNGWHTVPAPMGRPPVFYRKRADFAGLFAQLADL